MSNHEIIYNLIQEVTMEQKLKNLQIEVDEKYEFVKDYIEAIESVYTEEEIKSDDELQMNITEEMERVMEISTKIRDLENKIFTLEKSIECVNMILDCHELLEKLGVSLDNLRKYTM